LKFDPDRLRRSDCPPSGGAPSVENTKVPKPATCKDFSEAKMPKDCGVNNPLAIMPGATYAVKNKT